MEYRSVSLRQLSFLLISVSIHFHYISGNTAHSTEKQTNRKKQATDIKQKKHYNSQ